MSDPVLIAVDNDVDALRDIEETLRDRYASHYRVECMRSPLDARDRLVALAEAEEQVAVVLAGQGFVFTGSDVVPAGAWPLERPPLSLETSVPGVLAAGDLRHSAVRRVASAVGEGSVAVQLLHRLFALDDRHPRGRSKATSR